MKPKKLSSQTITGLSLINCPRWTKEPPEEVCPNCPTKNTKAMSKMIKDIRFGCILVLEQRNICAVEFNRVTEDERNRK